MYTVYYQMCIDMYTCIHISLWKTLLLPHRVMDFASSPGDSPLSTDTPHGDLRRSTPMVKLLKLDLLQVKGNSIAAVNMAVD